MTIKAPGDKDFNLDDSPLYNLNRTSATYTAEMAKALKAVGMDQTQWRVLGLLGDQNPSMVNELARKGVIKMSTLTRMLERMERDGLVTRKAWEQDKRNIQVFITDKGREALEVALSVNASVYKSAVEGLSEADLDQFMKVLKHMRENLNRGPHTPK
ncbi:MarR family winged helix-turn-helix transcriptional regulator [Emcibacter nanhaiensis]|uniref:MarR family transcriptional regulator n=1 Tax=Emcibacter nanhaiensis TaxID=1505037 RepID=A0A501PGJ8_9PROT|nr:MarR family transcriptional regulator [Emcibacter nanhaiensis]TPD59101.1 MarR family transcriptional regulator [Emcibacter nanhaiensis]